MPVVWTLKIDAYDVVNNLERIKGQLTNKEGALSQKFENTLIFLRKTLAAQFGRSRSGFFNIARDRNKSKGVASVSPSVWASAMGNAIKNGPKSKTNKGVGITIGNIGMFKALFNPVFLIERQYDHSSYNKQWWQSPLGEIAKQITNVKPGMYFVWTLVEFGIREHKAFRPGPRSSSGPLTSRLNGMRFLISNAGKADKKQVVGQKLFEKFYFTQLASTNGVYFKNIRATVKDIVSVKKIAKL